VIVDQSYMTAAELERATGWEIKPEGACKGDVCVPLPGMDTAAGTRIDVRDFAERLAMPVAYDEGHGLWALGPESGGRVLASATLPDLQLPDFDGETFDLASLRGGKVLLIAWASW
jgi:hypothetical protein